MSYCCNLRIRNILGDSRNVGSWMCLEGSNRRESGGYAATGAMVAVEGEVCMGSWGCDDMDNVAPPTSLG